MHACQRCPKRPYQFQGARSGPRLGATLCEWSSIFLPMQASLLSSPTPAVRSKMRRWQPTRSTSACNVSSLLESTHQTAMSAQTTFLVQSSAESSSQKVLTDFESTHSVGFQQASIPADQIQIQQWSTSTTNSELVHTILGSFQRRRVSTTQNMRIGKNNSQTTKVVTTYSIIPRFLQWSINLYRQGGNEFAILWTPDDPSSTQGHSLGFYVEPRWNGLLSRSASSNAQPIPRNKQSWIEPGLSCPR